MSQGRQPIHPETHQPLPLRKQPGYYPGFSTLKQQAFWDEATRAKVLKRVQETPRIRFFDPREANLMEVLASHILPQEDRERFAPHSHRAAHRRATAQRADPGLSIFDHACGWRCLSTRFSSH